MSRSKSSTKAKLSLSDLTRAPTVCITDRDARYLPAVYSMLCQFLSRMPPLDADDRPEQVFEEIKAAFAMLGKVLGAREAQGRERESSLRSALESERKLRLRAEQQLQELNSLEELKATKEIIKCEEEDLQRKMNYIEQKMDETLALKSSFERSFSERESELSHREASLRKEEERVVSRAKELHVKGKVLASFEKALKEEQKALEHDREVFRDTKSRWANSHISSESQECSQMMVEDCRSRLAEVNDLYSRLLASRHKIQEEAENLQQDRFYLEDTTQMLETLHEEILQDRQDMDENAKLIKSEWDLIKNEKIRLQEAWKVLEFDEEDPRSDPSTEESPMKLPEYRTPTDSWSTGFMSLQPVSFSESPVFLRKL